MCTAGEWRDAVTGVTVKDSIAIMAGNAAGAGAALVVRAAGG